MNRRLVNFCVRCGLRPFGVALVIEGAAIRILVGFVLIELEVFP
jgi:hypothetical protein